jgi:hypothetical protein
VEDENDDYEYWNIKPSIGSISSMGSRSISYDDFEESQATSALLQEMMPHSDNSGQQPIQHQIIQNHQSQQLKYMKISRLVLFRSLKFFQQKLILRISRIFWVWGGEISKKIFLGKNEFF